MVSIRHRTALLAILAPLGAVLAIAGCDTKDATNLTRDTASLARDTGQAISSVSLGAKVEGVLALRKGVDISGLHIEGKDGIVTISGHVRNIAERRRVIDTANGIRGVDKVINQIELSP